MKSRIYYFFSVVILNFTVNAQSNNLEQLLPSVQDAVFTIYASSEKGNAQGSGFFISSDGVGVTNFHVLEDMKSAFVKDRQGNRYEISSIIDYNPIVDLVKFRVNNARPVKVLEISNIEPKQGESIINISTPIGLDQTVSTGIISAIREDDSHGKVFQITAPISSGSSGSPVLDTKGRVIGVATFCYAEGQNLNFAVSIGQLDQLSKNLKCTVSDLVRDPLMTQDVRIAQECAIKGDFERAVSLLTKEIEKNSKNHLALFIRGRINDEFEYYGDALNDFFNASVLDPTNAIYYKYTGRCFTNLFIQAEEINNVVSPEEEAGLIEGAIKSFEMSLQFNPYDPETYYYIGKALYEYGHIRSRDNKIKGFDPTEYYKSAIDAFNTSIEIRPRQESYILRAQTKERQGQYALAIVDCNNCIEMDPEWYRGYFIRATLKYESRHLVDDALLDLDIALALVDKPSVKADILGVRGSIYHSEAMNKMDVNLAKKALSDFREAYKLNPSDVYQSRIEMILLLWKSNGLK